MTRLALLACAAALACAACDKGTSAGPAGSSASASAPSSSTSAAPAASSASSATSAGAAWAGKYTTVGGTLYYPRDAPNADDWKKLTWQGNDASAGIGEGTIALTIDGKTGVVTGSGDGALGPFTLRGSSADGQLSAQIDRKDPTDHGLTGNLVGKVTASSIDGTMKLSAPDAQLIRSGTFSLAPKQ